MTMRNLGNAFLRAIILAVDGQRTDVLSVTATQMITADMVPDDPGIWLYHCHISDHMLAGMSARYQVLPR
jgi:FtsP/CotA-like multicopper oxidase with cupredoxin domain